MPDTTDPVAAFLADVKMQAEDHHLVTGADALRLLGAVEAVLKGHTNEGVFLGAAECDHPEPSGIAPEALRAWDADHPLGGGDVGRICFLTEIGRYCPACTELVYEDDPIGDSYVDVSNCIVRPAISAVLLGEAAPGA